MGKLYTTVNTSNYLTRSIIFIYLTGVIIMDKNIDKVLKNWADRTVPDGMPTSEIKALAEKAGLNWETLRSVRRRKAYTAETIIRALLASGVEVKTLLSLPVNPKGSLLPKEKEWIQYGRTLSAKERSEFIELLKHVKKIMKERYRKD